MPLPDQQLRLQNPWWQQPDIWSSEDPHLATLRRHPALLPTPLADSLDIQRAGLYTFRGPRQVGKSTTLKLLAQRALKEGRSPSSIIYMSLDLLADASATELYLSVIRAKELLRSRGASLLMLDEVTGIKNWDEAVKVLWDDGVIREDVVICTGSSAIDLRLKAAERWPGRRGAGSDKLVLPYGFAAFARAIDSSIPPSPHLSIDDLFQEAGKDHILSMQVHLDRLRRAFELYLRFGGFPAAVSDAQAGALNPRPETVEIAWASILKEVARQGLSEVSLHGLLERIGRSLSSKTNWSLLAREMAIPVDSKTGLRAYLDTLAASYFVLILYAWKADLVGNDLSRDKKLYFADPLIAALAESQIPGLQVEEAALVENVISLALLRNYEPILSLQSGFHHPVALHFWNTQAGGEVDFLAGPRSQLAAVECKYQTNVSRSVFNGMRVAFPSRPLVAATKDRLEWGDGWAMIPAYLLCWAIANSAHP